MGRKYLELIVSLDLSLSLIFIIFILAAMNYKTQGGLGGRGVLDEGQCCQARERESACLWSTGGSTPYLNCFIAIIMSENISF